MKIDRDKQWWHERAVREGVSFVGAGTPPTVMDGRRWQVGIAGNANVVTYDGDDIVGVATVNPESVDRMVAEQNALLDEVLRLREAVYGPRDMTRDETNECMINRLREERDGFRDSYHAALSAASDAAVAERKACARWAREVLLNGVVALSAEEVESAILNRDRKPDALYSGLDGAREGVSGGPTHTGEIGCVCDRCWSGG